MILEWALIYFVGYYKFILLCINTTFNFGFNIIKFKKHLYFSCHDKSLVWFLAEQVSFFCCKMVLTEGCPLLKLKQTHKVTYFLVTFSWIFFFITGYRMCNLFQFNYFWNFTYRKFYTFDTLAYSSRGLKSSGLKTKLANLLKDILLFLEG